MATRQLRQTTETRQAEIVATFLRLAAERSALDISTTDIASAMNLSQGALFKHFPSKEAIRLAVVDWIEDALMQRLQAAQQSASSPLVALRDMFMAHVEFVIDCPGAPRFIFGELQSPDATPVKSRVCRLMQQYRTLLNQVLDEAMESRLIGSGIDRQAAAAMFLGGIQGLVIQSMISGDATRLRDQAQGVFQIYLLGLETRP